MNDRILHFDNKVLATGLNPEEVSKQSQAVEIFNPESKKYVEVQRSFAKSPENESNFVSVSGYEWGDKQFLLQKIGENEYHIKSLENNKKEKGFLYVSEHTTSGLIWSSSNVLRSKTITFKEELYVFEFIRHNEQKGVYKIRCKANGKVLFLSNDRNSQVVADKEDREMSNRIWFQISLQPVSSFLLVRLKFSRKFDNTEKETGFLYVSEHTTSGMIQSSSNVLRSKTIAFKEELYVFEFIRHSKQKGVYKIRCKANGKMFFVSNARKSQVIADKEDREISNTIWFQINIKVILSVQVQLNRTQPRLQGE